MKRFIAVLGIWVSLMLSSFSEAHKFYVSVTNVAYSEEEASLQIISRIFIDDLEDALKTRYEVDTHLATPEESGQAEAYIQRYFNSKFTVFVNGSPVDYTFLGKRYDNDLIVCYIEVAGIPKEQLKSVGIQNDILTDSFEEQKNLVHFNILGKKKSFVLVRENNKGMLNL
ncbi:MAG: DUF6702 family protein [Robiginitalea sp.]|nr:DUF6702 family protein [Robiginitalea sp.]